MMIMKATAVFSLFTVFGTQVAQAEVTTFADLRMTTVAAVSFPVLQTDPQQRIYLNTSMLHQASGKKRRMIPIGARSGPTANLKHLIGWAEAGHHGYDAVQYGASVRPAKPPTRMTIDEIYQWIEATPNQPHAIGRYQFIPATLKTLVHELGLSRNTLFTDEVQDRLADILLEDAGYSLFIRRQISRHTFMENLARIWAGFPTSTGRSYYDGHAGNRAVITWNEFDTHMKAIFAKKNS
ncbi:hypothetical protein [uncultured Sulfitobacter sp.]|uniref:hypothetical protein n=1 Tax=uncultured Sulfitobacter sp. TaxID=191468 RepID=UPI0030D84665|tara:strand:+ start:185637 stop:186350 length:714 start_codon:yes stop_codon:yes gene_type:complete